MINIARNYKPEMVNYSALELLKDGVWSSGKYLGKSCTLGVNGISICLIVAMNYEPDLNALSKDRYELWHLDYVIYSND